MCEKAFRLRLCKFDAPLLAAGCVKRGRLTLEETRVEDSILLNNLHLIGEDCYLIRAAMLAFYKDPEKWVTGSYCILDFSNETFTVF